MNKKKGQTLVEVIVALGILTMIVTAVITMIVAAMNLLANSRIKTEAVAFAQKRIADAIAAYDFGNPCIINPVSIPTDTMTDSNGTVITVTMNTSNLTAGEKTSFGGPGPADKFIKMIATATWDYRGVASDPIVIVEYVRSD